MMVLIIMLLSSVYDAINGASVFVVIVTSLTRHWQETSHRWERRIREYALLDVEGRKLPKVKMQWRCQKELCAGLPVGKNVSCFQFDNSAYQIT